MVKVSSCLEMREYDPRPYPEEKALYKERSPINSLDTWKTATAFFQVGLMVVCTRDLCSLLRDKQEMLKE